MSNIPSASNTLRDLWSRATLSLSSPTPPPVAGLNQADRDRADAAIDALVTPSISLSTVVARMDPAGAKLDQLRAAASGPYTVNGAIVYSGAQFRMVGGHNQSVVPEPGAKRVPTDFTTLVRVAASIGLEHAVPSLQSARGDARDLVRLTQALIDDGQLSPDTTKSPEARIHDVQWRFGIGLDCASYVYQALASVHGDPAKLGLRPIGCEDFTGLSTNDRFRNVAPPDTRAGDVITLAGKGWAKGDPGHNLVVRSHAVLEQPGESVTSRWGDAAGFIAAAATSNPKASIHVFEVDSSFGAGTSGDPHGGVRRDVLLWNSQSNAWCTCKDIDPPTVLNVGVPYGEVALTGIFHPKEVR
jgi:hypothetical protein